MSIREYPPRTTAIGPSTDLPDRLRRQIDEWSVYLVAVRARKPTTVERYVRHVEGFLDPLIAEGVEGGEDVTAQHLLDHLRALYVAGLASATRRLVYSSVRSWGEWLVTSGRCELSPFARVPSPPADYRPEVEALTVGEVERLLAQPLPENPIGVRNRTMVALMYWLGLRPSELDMPVSALRATDRNSLRIRLRHTKWSNEDQFQTLVDPATLHLLGHYGTVARPVLVESDPESPWLFPSVLALGRSGRYRVRGPLRRETACRIVAQELRAIRPRGRTLSAKILRHSLGTHLVEAGWNLRVIQKVLRHRSIKTTQIYTNPRPGRVETMLRTRPPIKGSSHPLMGALASPGGDHETSIV